MKGQCFFIFILTAEVACGITMKINTEARELYNHYLDNNVYTLNYIYQSLLNKFHYKNIKLIRKKGFENISISAVYTKYMERHENEFNELCEKYDAVPIIRNLFLNGRANINEDDLVPSDYLWHITRSREISCRHCRAGERELYISSTGEIYP